MEDDQVNLSPSFTGDHKTVTETRRNYLQRGSRSLSPSPPNLSSSGNNENESESNRNSMEKGTNSESKGFMAPTISTSSKSMTLKKKILAEWSESSPNALLKKPSKNLGPKWDSTKMGTSNSSSNPKNCLPKIPNSSSSSYTSLKCDDGVKFEDDESFVPENSTMPPYDPLTNYLSPRPKFLRYNPNRRREAVDLSQVEEGSSRSRSRSRSSRSRASTSYSTAEGCMKLEMSDNKGDSEKEEEEEEEEEVDVEQVVVENEEEEEEEVEDVMKIGERKSGLKWKLFESLIVVVVLVFLTMYISSMNNSSCSTEPMRGLEVEYRVFENNSFRGVSLANVELGGWVFADVKEESEISLFEFSDEIVIDSGGNLSRETIEMSDSVEDQEVMLAGKIEFSEDYYQNVSRFGNDVSPKPIQKSFEDMIQEETLVIEDMMQEEALVNEDMMHEENEVPIIMNSGSDLESNEDMIQEEALVDYEPNSEDGQLTNEVEFVAKEAPHQEVELESISKDEQLENEAENIEDQNEIIEEEAEPELVESHPIKEAGVEDESIIENGDEIIEEEAEVEDESIIENGDEQWWVKLNNVLCFVIPLMMTWVGSLVMSFYLNCKKASSETISSTKPVMFEKSRSRLPPKSGDKISHTQKTNDPHSNPPHSREEKLEKSPSRFISKVQMLSEYEVAGEFMRRCDLGSKLHEDNEHSIHSVPEESRRVINKAKAPKMAFSSPAPSHSVLSTCDSQDGKEEVSKRTTETPTTLSRSNRLRSKGVQSP